MKGAPVDFPEQSSEDCLWGHVMVFGFDWADSISLKVGLLGAARGYHHYETFGRMVACKVCQGYHIIFEDDGREVFERSARFGWRSKNFG